jgi:thiamine pyrophosphate-dependent acetolactate synthase large subunit-like protein
MRVTDAAELRGALERALSSPVPIVLDVHVA